MSVATFTKTGTKATTAAKLDKAIFGIEVENHELIKQAYVAYLANGRENLAVTKTRGLVRGGGKKPWKQKGTGRARFGSSRVPIWRGGGITFGPTGIENYSHKINVKAKRLAVRQALSMANKDEKIIIIESFDSKSGKTNDIVKLLAKVGTSRQTLVIVDAKTPELLRATANIPELKVVQATYLNVFDLLNARHIVVTQKALPVIADWLNAPTAKATGEEK